MDKTLFANKIAHYARCEPKHFLQLDGHFLPAGGDDIMRPDDDGDWLSMGPTVELMHGATTRVLVPLDTDLDVVVRQLKKISKMLRRDAKMLKTPEPPSANNRSRAPWATR